MCLFAIFLPTCHIIPGYISRRSEEHTSELQSRLHLVCRLLLEKKKTLTPPRVKFRPRFAVASRKLGRSLACLLKPRIAVRYPSSPCSHTGHSPPALRRYTRAAH